MSDERFAGDAALLGQLPAESAFIALTTSGPAGQRAMPLVVDRRIDWGRLIHLAARERAVLALNEQLRRTPIRGALPADLMNLQQLALVSEFQMSSLHDRLVKLLALYALHGIDVLLLKGVGLAHSAYERPTDRPMGDIDVLVRTSTASRAWELALANGWARRGDVPAERSYADHQHLSPLEDADGLQIGLELHTALFTHQAPFRLPPEQLWAARGVSRSAASRPMCRARRTSCCTPRSTSRVARDDVRRVPNASGRGANPRRLADRLAALVRQAQDAHGATCCYWTLRLARDLAGGAGADRRAGAARAAPSEAGAAGAHPLLRGARTAQPRLHRELRVAVTRLVDARDPATPAGPRSVASVARHGGMGQSARRHEKRQELRGKAAHASQLWPASDGREPPGPVTDFCASSGNRLSGRLGPMSRQMVWQDCDSGSGRIRHRTLWRVRCLAVTACWTVPWTLPRGSCRPCSGRGLTGYVRCLFQSRSRHSISPGTRFRTEDRNAGVKFTPAL
jgi:hypothetical protein